ncbi:hypothetical protein McPS_22370 [Marichromatium sp. PS1]
MVRIDLKHGTINRLSHLNTPVTIMTQGYLVKIVITIQNRTFLVVEPLLGASAGTTA